MFNRTLLVIALVMAGLTTGAFAAEAKPLKALLITGGCCHDYEKQVDIISKGLSARANVTWDVIFEGKDKEMIKFYGKEGWAKPYDVIVHNECHAGYKDEKVIEKIVQDHSDAKVGVIMIHCAMHTFRGTKSKAWDNLVGVQSRNHGAKFPITLKVLKKHPIIKNVPDGHKTPQGELYATNPLPDTTPLLEGSRDGQEKGKQVCVWISKHKDTRTFGITLGHHNQTMQDKVWQDMVARGLLWTCDKLDDKGEPKAGYGPTKQARVRFLNQPPVAKLPVNGKKTDDCCGKGAE